MKKTMYVKMRVIFLLKVNLMMTNLQISQIPFLKTMVLKKMILLSVILRIQAKHYIPEAALNSLIKFLFVFFSVIGRTSPYVAKIVASFPRSLYDLRRRYNLTLNFKKIVVCSKCHSTYDFSECVERNGTNKISRKCWNRQQIAYSHPCNQVLLQTVELLGGNKILRPFKIFCYCNLLISLRHLLQQQSFISNIENWRNRPIVHDTFQDIYDGWIWKEFMHVEGRPFLAGPYFLALAMNIDWFQPFKWREYSVGVMYLTVMNLPYHIRFKREFVIQLGIIPGPKEPKRTINSYLQPLVGELLDLWRGVPMPVFGTEKDQIVRCALICVACDMPASRKTCGLLGHTATFGCTKCKEFGGEFGKRDYSGFDRENWPLRNNDDHRSSVMAISQSKTKTDRTQLESQHGCRFSSLLDLPYFDPVRMTVVDPMHNLFLGTAKHLVKNVWMKQELLKKPDLSLIQDVIR